MQHLLGTSRLVTPGETGPASGTVRLELQADGQPPAPGPTTATPATAVLDAGGVQPGTFTEPHRATTSWSGTGHRWGPLAALCPGRDRCARRCRAVGRCRDLGSGHARRR
ncbi:hypothetical protein [Modestobacter sp. KNN46-3]|uniref:hypothetical protein n=1 Tax=Modestobacter sp. KNN46-3 TaxID=2711218 RepID=UPI001F14A106|nr:hypothetical protein [Modestobacter sp. KNN46-3]